MSTNMNAAFLIPAFCALATFDPHYISNAVILYKSHLIFTTPFVVYFCSVLFRCAYVCACACVYVSVCVRVCVCVCVLAVGQMTTSGSPPQET